MAVTMNFYGLCAIGSVNGTYTVVMPTAMGHEAVLLARASEVFLKQSTPAHFVGFDVTTPGQQLVGWKLDVKAIAFETASGTPTWAVGARESIIDFQVLAPGSGAQLPPHAAKFALPSGVLSAGAPTAFDLIKPNGLLEHHRYAERVMWTGQFLNIVAPDLKIALHDGAVITITNVAKEADSDKGMSHFDHYYDCLAKNIVPADRCKLKEGSDEHVDVYDCVPPAHLPDGN